jgi:hypothetical protein
MLLLLRRWWLLLLLLLRRGRRLAGRGVGVGGGVCGGRHDHRLIRRRQRVELVLLRLAVECAGAEPLLLLVLVLLLVVLLLLLLLLLVMVVEMGVHVLVLVVLAARYVGHLGRVEPARRITTLTIARVRIEICPILFELRPPILEPNFHLRLRKRQLGGQLGPIGQIQIMSGVEFLIQAFQLFARVNGARLSRLLALRQRDAARRS